jgi:cysteine desulfurase
VERRVYMDHSATTPVDQAVVEAMLPYFSESFGNASTLYALGREAREAVEMAREQVAQGLGANPEEIVFTSGGTESDNLGIKGVAYGRKDKGHIITTSIEHPAVLNTCEHLESEGFEVTFLPVNEYGQVSAEELDTAMRDDTFLVSIGYGNNEIGTVQDIKKLAKVVHARGALLHTDAVQAVTKLPIDVKDIGVDLLSLSGHKIYGPKGVGALYVRKGVDLAPLMHGGGHEHGLRSGTENVPGIVGLGKAVELGTEEMGTSIPRIRGLRDRLTKGILDRVDDAFLNGHPERRLPHNAHFRFSYIEGEAIILNLDFLGIAAATGSACSSKSLKASHVLLAIGLTPEEAHGSLRLTLGRGNTDEDVDYVLEKVPQVVEKLRAMSPLGKGR